MQPRETSINISRTKLLHKMVGDDQLLNTKSRLDFAKLPPCKDSLIPHIQRTNHRVACYKRAQEAVFERPKPEDENQGWEKTEQGLLEPIWSCGPTLPLSLTDILETVHIDDDSDIDTPEDLELCEIDYDDMIQYFDDE